MTIHHHPTDETLAAFAAGSLDEARAVVVATHVSLCPHCRGGMRAAEEAGGLLLERGPSVALAPDALERALSRIVPAHAHRLERNAVLLRLRRDDVSRVVAGHGHDLLRHVVLHLELFRPVGVEAEWIRDRREARGRALRPLRDDDRVLHHRLTVCETFTLL